MYLAAEDNEKQILVDGPQNKTIINSSTELVMNLSFYFLPVTSSPDIKQYKRRCRKQGREFQKYLLSHRLRIKKRTLNV